MGRANYCRRMRLCMCCNAQCGRLAPGCPYVIPGALWLELLRLGTARQRQARRLK
jgi:hypothetical protein